MKKYSSEIQKAIKKYLEDEKISYSFDLYGGDFRFQQETKSRIKIICYLIHVNYSDFIVYACSPLGVDIEEKETVKRMAEFICRINQGSRKGYFEFNMDNGEIKYKIYNECNDGIIPTEATIRSSIDTGIAKFERYGNAITEVIFGNKQIKDIVENFT